MTVQAASATRQEDATAMSQDDAGAMPQEVASPMQPLAVTQHTLVTALGDGRAATVVALREGRSGLRRIDFETAALGAWLGQVDGLDTMPWPRALTDFDCRNNRVAERGLLADGFADAVVAPRDRHGAGRIGVFLGTSTSGILQTELAYRRRDPATGALPAELHYATTHNTYSVARYVREASAPNARPDELAWIKLRYKEPGDKTSKLIEMPLRKPATLPAIDKADADFRFAAAVAGWGQWLRGSTLIGEHGPAQFLPLARGARGEDRHGHRAESLRLMELSASLRR